MRALRPLFFLAMAAGSAFITAGAMSYFVEGDMHPFVLEKVDAGLTLDRIYVAALVMHVVSALFSLPACLALMSRWLLRTLPQVHRWLGRITGAVVLLALVPSGASACPDRSCSCST